MKRILQKSMFVLAIATSAIALNAQSNNFSVELSLGASTLHHSRSRLLDNGNVITTLFDNGTGSSYIVMLSPSGAKLWSKSYLSTKIEDVKQLPDGNFAFIGTYNYNNVAWGVLDQSGNEVWAKQYYSFQNNYDLASIDLLKSGKILYNFSKYDRSITVRCDENGDMDDMDEGEDTLGYGKNPSFDSFECEDSGWVTCHKSDDRIMLVRHNQNGDVMWAKDYMKGSTEYFHLKKIKELSDGSLMGVGLVSDTYSGLDNKGFVIKLDANGEVLWTKKYLLPTNPGYFSSTFRNFEVVGTEIYVSGYYTTDYVNMNNFIIKLDENGNVLTSKQMLGTNSALAYIPLPTMAYVTFEQDINSQNLVYNNYSYTVGVNVEINKVGLDGTLGCSVADFSIPSIAYPAIAGTMTAHYGELSILETAPASILDLTLAITTSEVAVAPSCASVAGINENSDLNLSVYPNPTTDVLNIAGLDAQGHYTIQIIDLNGKVILFQNGIEGVELTTISAGNIANGSYIVKVIDLNTNSNKQMKWMKM